MRVSEAISGKFKHLNMTSEHSISHWFAGLKTGEAEAAQKLWDRYSVRLVDLARDRLGGAPKRVADEEDVVQSVFQSLCRGAAAGRFQNVKNRDDLWWLLLAITKQKVVDHIRREMAQKRGAGRVQTETALSADAQGSKRFTLDHLVSQDPTPEYLAILDEQHRRLLGLLRDDRLRKIAVSRIEGYTVGEIASDLAVTTRTVERKLQLIRITWAKDMASDESPEFSH